MKPTIDNQILSTNTQRITSYDKLYFYVSLLIIFIFLVYFYKRKKETFKDGYHIKNINESSFKTKSVNNDFHIEKICESIYIDKNNEKFKVINIFDKKECNNIIKEAEDFAKIHKWKKRRHEYYQTTDNRITKNWSNWNMIYKKVRNIIFPILESMYNLKKEYLGINEIFIAKYSENGQKKLNYHQDGSVFSFIIGLNEEFTGGGTKFKKSSKNIILKTGEGLIFSGQNTHKGTAITSGKRYILAGFLNYGGNNFCQNYFREYMRFN